MATGSLDAGDLAWVEFGSTLGHEQSGRRPGLVLSPRDYNERSSLALVCPITRRDRVWPFKVAIPIVGRISGFALVDHIRSVDQAERIFGLIGHVPDDVMAKVRARLAELLQL